MGNSRNTALSSAAYRGRSSRAPRSSRSLSGRSTSSSGLPRHRCHRPSAFSGARGRHRGQPHRLRVRSSSKASESEQSDVEVKRDIRAFSASLATIVNPWCGALDVHAPAERICRIRAGPSRGSCRGTTARAGDADDCGDLRSGLSARLQRHRIGGQAVAARPASSSSAFNQRRC